MDNNLREVLYNTIELFIDWEKDLTNIDARKINKVMYSFINLLITKDIDEIPLNLPQFIFILENKTLGELGFSEEETTKQLVDERIIVNGRLNNILIKWYEDLVNLTEAEQKAMFEFLQLCRAHRGKEDEIKYCDFYRSGRSLVNKNNMIMTNIKFQSLLKEFPTDLRKVISSWRKNVNILSETIRVCPVCGKQVEFDLGKEGFCSDICNYFIRKKELSFETLKIQKDDQYSAFSEGIYRYILLPNIGERIIYENLLKNSEIEVELYPNMDEYDIKISFEGNELLLDVKDVQTPAGLVNKLKENNTLHKLMNVKGERKLSIIPEHRKGIYLEQTNVDYKKELVRILDNEGLELEVLYEKELYKEINELINDDF